MSHEEHSWQADSPESCEINSSGPIPEDQQRELHARYLEQQRRMSCPGCGEGVEVY